MNRLRALSLLAIPVLCASSATAQSVELVNAFPNLSFNSPVDVATAPDGSDRLFVLAQYDGIIWVFDNDPATTQQSVFLDISDRIFTNGEEVGLLALAFHPDYLSNGFFYVTYGATQPRRNVISRFSVTADPDVADPASELVLLEVTTLSDAHTTHRLVFGPDDGYLYIAAGDGACCGDPFEQAQDRTTLRGNILRIDVDNPADGGLNYGIPPDNPFVGNPFGWREEIFAYGFRNPWRLSFDAEGRLWAGDVGQDSWEEVSQVVSGGNYGWPVMEGTHCFDPPVGCNQTGLELPIWDYPHQFDENGGFAVTGGFVYRGAECPDLLGQYIYGDFISGNLWALEFDETGALGNETLVPLSGVGFSGFGEDQNGELYFTDYFADELLRMDCDGGGGGIPCGDVMAFQARCRSDATLQARVLLTDLSHDGETVTVAVNGALEVLTVNGRRATLSQPSTPAGDHVVRLVEPGMCQPNVIVTCPR